MRLWMGNSKRVVTSYIFSYNINIVYTFIQGINQSEGYVEGAVGPYAVVRWLEGFRLQIDPNVDYSGHRLKNNI